MATDVIWKGTENFRREDSAISVYIFSQCAKSLDASIAVYVRRIQCFWGNVLNGLYILQVVQVSLYNPVLVAIAGFKNFLSLFLRFSSNSNTLY